MGKMYESLKYFNIYCMKFLKTYEAWNSFGGDIERELTLKEVIDMSQLSDIEDVSTWLSKDIEDLKFYFKKEPIEKFLEQAKEMEGTLDEFLDEKERTEHIYDLLKSGEDPMPVFVKRGDSSKFIMEGRHRIVAFMWYGFNKIPVIYAE